MIASNYLQKQVVTCISLLALLVVLVSPAFAAEDEYILSFTKGDTSLCFAPSGTCLADEGIVNDNGGTIENVEFRFNTTTNILSVDMELSGPTVGPDSCGASPSEVAKMITFVITSGEMPHPFQNAVFFLDATDAVPSLSVYAYDGDESNPTNESYVAGDNICTSRVAGSCSGWLQSLNVQNTALGKRYTFSVDVTAINSYVPTNVGPEPYEGVSFAGNVGFWVQTHGYPNLDVIYGADGFIDDVVADIDPACSYPIDGIYVCTAQDELNGSCDEGDRLGNSSYSGFFDKTNADTYRTPVCDQESMNFSLEVDVPFQTLFTGGSPDGKDVTINYSGVPSGASVDPADGTVQAGTINGSFSWTPTSADAGQQFDVGVTYTDSMDNSVSCPFTLFVDEEPTDCLGVSGGDATLDQCGQCNGDGTSCLGCEDVDISATQGTLDSQAEAQYRIVRRLNRQLKTVSRGTANEATDKQFGSRQKQRAKTLFEENWGFIWSIPSVNTQCANADFCVQVASGIESVQLFSVNTQELVSIANKLARRIAKRGGNAKRLKRQANALGDDSLALVATVPTTESVCTTDNNQVQ